MGRGGTLASLLCYASVSSTVTVVTIFMDNLVFCGGFLTGCFLTGSSSIIKEPITSQISR